MISETALNRELGAGVEIGPFRPFPVLSTGRGGAIRPRGWWITGVKSVGKLGRETEGASRAKWTVGSDGADGVAAGRESTGPPNTRV